MTDPFSPTRPPADNTLEATARQAVDRLLLAHKAFEMASGLAVDGSYRLSPESPVAEIRCHWLASSLLLREILLELDAAAAYAVHAVKMYRDRQG